MYMLTNVGSKVLDYEEEGIVFWECEVCKGVGRCRINNWNSPRARTCCGGRFVRNRDRLLVVWTDMRSRCIDTNHPAYERYRHFGRPGWDSYEDFASWAIDAGWSYGLEIDRVDNNSGYRPDNCRFVSRKANTRNRKSNRLVTAFGETKTAVEWSEDFRCSVQGQSILARIDRYGFTPEEAITRPAK